MKPTRKPTAKECAANVEIEPTDSGAWFALRTPQINGYSGDAAIHIERTLNNVCFEIAIWHDGEFSTDEESEPLQLHFCDPEQFIRSGKLVIKLQEQVNGTKSKL